MPTSLHHYWMSRCRELICRTQICKPPQPGIRSIAQVPLRRPARRRRHRVPTDDAIVNAIIKALIRRTSGPHVFPGIRDLCHAANLSEKSGRLSVDNADGFCNLESSRCR